MNYLYDGITRVCMYCHPRNSILETHPEWKAAGVQISHGICPVCMALALKQLGVIEKRIELHEQTHSHRYAS
jgi:hypothetical protein